MVELLNLFLGEWVKITDQEDDFYGYVGEIIDSETFEGDLRFIVQFENTQVRQYTKNNFKVWKNEGVI